jgi:hypothetical protein
MIPFFVIFYDRNALIESSYKGYLNIVEFLISKGANIEAKDNHNYD